MIISQNLNYIFFYIRLHFRDIKRRNWAVTQWKTCHHSQTDLFIDTSDLSKQQSKPTLAGPLRLFWGWFNLIDRCLSLLYSTTVVATFLSHLTTFPFLTRVRISDSGNWQWFKTTPQILLSISTVCLQHWTWWLSAYIVAHTVQWVWLSWWCITAVIAPMYRSLFMVAAGWQTGRESQHAWRILSVQLSLKALTAQEHKARDSNQALFIRRPATYSDREMMQQR